MTYLKPQNTRALPNGFTLDQFIQTVLVGVSGIDPQLVRPEWQKDGPKIPDVVVNWLAYGITQAPPDANGYIGMNGDGVMLSQRHADLMVMCAFYGPQALDYATIVRDGFQIPNNRSQLSLANMGFVSTGTPLHIPDLVNERWVNRYQLEIRLRIETERTYDILSLLGAHGTINTVVGTQEQSSNWETPEET